MGTERSQLETAVSAVLKRNGIDALHEEYRLPVTITVNTQPDYWLPNLGIVLEVKGQCATWFEFKKIVNTHLTVAEGIVNDDVTYSRYIVAVQLNDGDLKLYLRNYCQIDALVRVNSRGSFPLTGLRLLAALQRANVNAVPVTYKTLGLLINALTPSKRGKNVKNREAK
jgi:hypothetical protein